MARKSAAVGPIPAHQTAAIAAVRKVAQTDDVAAIRKAADELQRVSHAIAEQLYKTAQPGPQQSQGTHSSQSSHVKDAEVVDAEYAETK